MKKKVICFLACILMFINLTISAFGELNIGNDDGTDFGHGTDDNYWGVHTDSGLPLYDTEGLRVTIYDAGTNEKVFNTIDITGNPNISAVSEIYYFADGSELIPKTTWLNLVGSTYNSLGTNDMVRFNNTVTERRHVGDGYSVQYVSQLASIDIISTNNTSHLEEIKDILSDREFLNALCSLIGGSLTYSDIAAGRYKIAFEPIAYFRYNAQNWALSATECGLLDQCLRNTFSASWNRANNVRALLGPLTHSNLPRSAFLERRELNIPAYSPTSTDYYNGNANYNSDTCIIRCMGIGVLTADGSVDDTDVTPGTTVAEYHTDTDVYTSFNVTNIGGTTYVGNLTFGIYDADGETPRKKDKFRDDKVVVRITGSQSGVSYTEAYPTADTVIDHVSENSSVAVYVDNPDYDAETNPYVKPYNRLGTFRNGDELGIDSGFDSAAVNYTVKTRSGDVIANGQVNITCPAEENSMGWFRWHTPQRAQDVIIRITSPYNDLLLVDDDGNRRSEIIIEASIEEVTENTPPDPKVSDTRPAWQTLYSESSVQRNIAQYTSTDNTTQLSWYTWALTSSGWSQHEKETTVRTSVVTNGIQNPYSPYPYLGAHTENQDVTIRKWGVDNRYYASSNATVRTGQFIESAVYISTSDIRLERVTYTVSVSADATVLPSDHCYTAKYNTANDTYTMKSGYGVQIEVNAHITGDTQFCTGSQTANVLFPEFNYNRRDTAQYNRLLEKVNGSFVFKTNEYSTYNDRVHFTPIWYPDRKYYTVYIELFDVWCPAGQLSVRLTDKVYIKGNVYDDWHVAPVALG